jgi:hypothetical protein
MSKIMLFAERAARAKDIENTRVRERWRMNSSRYETLVGGVHTASVAHGTIPARSPAMGHMIAPFSRNRSNESA